MSTIIYYFSGTGNSLKIARDLAEGLDDTELVSLARATEEQLRRDADVVGIVFPVYAWGPPAVVARFLGKVSIGSDRYVFAVCTCGGSAGGTLARVRKQLLARGIALSSGFVIPMPTNYIAWGRALPEEKQQDMFARARVRVAEILTVIKEKNVREVETGGLLRRVFLSGPIYRVSMWAFKKQDKKFVLGPECNGCGICEKVCQVGNIRIEEGKPTWLQRCEQCLACLQWCPQEAVQVGKRTRGRKRYHQPDIGAKDLM